MTVEEIFIKTMSLIDEKLENGSIDAATTAEYKAKTPDILTILQDEIVGIENRYRSQSDMVYPSPIVLMEQSVIIDQIKANTLLTNGLAAHLMIHEDPTLANFFQQRYEELKGLFLKPSPSTIEKIQDVYNCSLY